MIHTTAPIIVLIDDGSGLTADEILNWSEVMTRQLLEDFGEIWNLVATTRVQTPDKPLQPGEWPHYLHDQPTATDPDGALAYHGRLDDGTPVMHSFVGLCKQLGESASKAASHENLETLIDELLNECVQNEADGSIWAKEVCDACEAIGYDKDGVTLSDFCTPEWFAPPAHVEGVKYNWLGTMTSPFQILDGGYGQKLVGEAWVQQGTMSKYRQALHDLRLGRNARRAKVVLQGVIPVEIDHKFDPAT